jgi:dipeptidyl aminopeptidase/acylaminoacyl peptidase
MSTRSPGTAPLEGRLGWWRLALGALSVLLGSPQPSSAMQRPPVAATQNPTAAAAKPALQPADYARWETLGPAWLSPDGRWIAYQISREDGDELRLADVGADSTRAFAFAGYPAFSRDNRWLAFTIGRSESERERLQAAGESIRGRMGLLDLSRGLLEELDGINSFEFSPNGEFLAIRGEPAPDDPARGSDLILRDLATGRDTHFGSIATYAWSDRGATLALVVEAGSSAEPGLYVLAAASGRLHLLETGSSGFSQLVWRRQAADLAALRSRVPAGGPDLEYDVVAWKALDGAQPERHVLQPTVDGASPGFRVVDYRGLTWSDDGSKIFFGLQDLEPATAVSTANAGATGPTASLDIWHSQDLDIVPAQRVGAVMERFRSDLAVWHVEAGRMVRLSDASLADIELFAGGRVAIGGDRRPYAAERMFGPILKDFYAIDVGTGARRPIARRIQHAFGASPQGRYFLYLDGNDFWSYDLQSGESRNLTVGLPAEFVDNAHDHAVEQKPPFGVGGWTPDDRSVILNDRYDLWEVRADGSGARRLTRGAQDSVRHRVIQPDREADVVDLSRPLYLGLFGEWTKRSGFAILSPAGTVDRAVWIEGSATRLVRARDAEVYAYVRQAFDVSPDLWVAGPGLRDARRATHTNAFADDYAWGRAELIDFRNTEGDRLQAALYYPAGYQPGQRYPMIVHVYERPSLLIHNYVPPSETSPFNVTVFTSRGYFVLRPDIVYRPRNPGLSAVAAIVPAVQAVLATGMVDPARVGLAGHSWGGYQTAFAVTQTDVFAAAAAGAPLTDLISMYGSVYWNTGETNARLFESWQGRMEVPPWEDLEAYVANSPVMQIRHMNTPLLVSVGDRDGQVDWNQAIELYNAARRTGKDLVLLVYEGEGHDLRRRPNQIDQHRRVLEWFDHYLKGAEPAAWITHGVRYLDRETEWLRIRDGTPGPGVAGP